MTLQELLDAVRPCLPLPGIETIGIDHDINGVSWKLCGPSWRDLRETEIVGAIEQACEERGWSTHTMRSGKRGFSILGPYSENDSGWRVLGESQTTDVLGRCLAYAQAKETAK